MKRRIRMMRLFALLTEQGYTVQQLAEMASITVRQIYRYRTGAQEMPYKTEALLYRLAQPGARKQYGLLECRELVEVSEERTRPQRRNSG